jgi:hypothetical protein
MSDNDLKKENKHGISFNLLSLSFSILGLLFILINILGVPVGFLSFGFGAIALMIAWDEKRATLQSVVLIILSIFVMLSYFIAWRVAEHIDALSIVRYDAPENVYPIRREGYIYDILRVSEEQIFYVYFAKEECEECEAFNVALETVLDGEDSPTVFYYDIAAMPDEEAEDVLNRLNIDRVPYLIKLEKGNVVDSVTVADEDALKQFFEN